MFSLLRLMPTRLPALDSDTNRLKIGFIERFLNKAVVIWAVMMGRSCMYRVSLQVVETPDGFPALEIGYSNVTVVENVFKESKRLYPKEMYETVSG